jgi:hypothetical protein
MSKLIALKSGTHEVLSDAFNSEFSILKQQSLLFDQIGIFKLNDFYNALEEALRLFKKPDSSLSNIVNSIITELEWLKQEDIIFELNIEEELSNPPAIRANVGQQFQNAKNLLNRIMEIQTIDLKSLKDDSHRKNLIEEQQFTLLRFMVIAMEAMKGVTAVTTFPYKEFTRELPNTNKSIVAQVVIDKLPLPSSDTPWEQIIDYRNDPENQESLLSLRRWIRKISTENLSSSEIEDELQWLMNEFQNHMRVHKMKTNTETLEIMVKAPLELIEDLVKLKFSKIPEPVFALKKRQINLLEAELNAPGREMAYIIKTRDTFQSHE